MMKNKTLILALVFLLAVLFTGSVNAYIQEVYLDGVDSSTYTQGYYANFYPETLDKQFVWAEITFDSIDDTDIQSVVISTYYSKVNQSYCAPPFCAVLAGGNLIRINQTQTVYMRDEINSYTYPVIVFRELTGNKQDIKAAVYGILVDVIYADGTVKMVSPVNVDWKIATSNTNICDIFKKYYFGIIHNDAALLYQWAGNLITLNGELFGIMFLIIKIVGFMVILGALFYLLLFIVTLVKGGNKGEEGRQI